MDKLLPLDFIVKVEKEFENVYVNFKKEAIIDLEEYVKELKVKYNIIEE